MSNKEETGVNESGAPQRKKGYVNRRLLVGATVLAGPFYLASCARLEAPTVSYAPTDSMSPASRPNREKKLSIRSINIHEQFNDIVFWRNGHYVRDGLDRLNTIMRDWRQNRETEIDPNLYMTMYDILKGLGKEGALIHLISGYRTERTNRMLQRNSRGVASNSYHIQGKAADIRIPGVRLSDVRDAAYDARGGGVGYYPASTSNFVHIDTGPVRRW